VFEQIEVDITKLLEENMDAIEECQLNREPVGWSMYMRGQDIDHAEPVLLFDCLDAKTRAKVVAIVKESQLWKVIVKKYPALRLASSARVPQECISDQVAANLPDVIDASGAVFSNGMLHYLCGVQIYVDVSKNSLSSSFRKATLGGIVLVDNVPHGITVAHAFKDILQQQSYPEDAADEFNFEDDGKFEDVYGVEDISMKAEINSLNDFDDIGTASINMDKGESIPGVDCSAKEYLGSVRRISLQYPNDTLDWALIPIEGKRPNIPNSVTLPAENGTETVIIDGIADPEPTSDEIWAVTACNGPVKGRLSTVPYYLKMTGCKTFQRTRMACLETKVGWLT